MLTDAQLDDIRRRPENSCEVVAGRWVTLRRVAGRLVGPCPLCSSDPQSRRATCFEIKDGGEAWVCAKCGGGGDVIALVMRHEGKEFRDAIEWLGGPRAIDPEAEARRAKERAAAEAKRRATEDEFRQRERRTLYDIWGAAVRAPGTPLEDYLRRWSAVDDVSNLRLRYVSDMPYFHGKTADGKERVIHRGPAMVAPIVGTDGKFRGLHFTYIDLTQPKGKARITDPESGEELPAKKVRGSKAGGRIELCGPVEPQRIVAGEGIETTLFVWAAMRGCRLDIADTAFWSLIDLGNIGGAAKVAIAHPTARDAAGRPRRVPGPEPDLEKPGVALPPSVTDVVLLGDGDSDPVTTQCALYRGQVRLAA